jgi:ABC-type oligopeptide transport system substrate-binding subunit
MLTQKHIWICSYPTMLTTWTVHIRAQHMMSFVNKADSGADASDSAKRWKDYQDAEKLLVDTDPAVIPVYQKAAL